MKIYKTKMKILFHNKKLIIINKSKNFQDPKHNINKSKIYKISKIKKIKIKTIT